MRILLSNDDGYHAPGLAVLERIAARLSELARDIDERSRAPR